MEKNTPPYESPEFTREEVYVNEIAFYGNNSVSLLGFVNILGTFVETEYITTRNDLQTLLNPCKPGKEILRKAENIFRQPHAVPVCINLIEMFGTTQIFEAMEIALEMSYVEKETGLLEPKGTMDVLFIENVIPFPSAR